MWGNPRRDIRASDADRERVGLATGDPGHQHGHPDSEMADHGLAGTDGRRSPVVGPATTGDVEKTVAARYALLDAAAVVIWFFTGRGGEFWPIWVIILTAMLFARRALRAIERRSTAKRAAIEGRDRPWLP